MIRFTLNGQPVALEVIWTSTQPPFPAPDLSAQGLRIKQDDVRVITPCIGGGFGGKSAGPQVVEAALLPAATRRPLQARVLARQRVLPRQVQSGLCRDNRIRVRLRRQDRALGQRGGCSPRASAARSCSPISRTPAAGHPRSAHSIDGFQTSQTLPTRSGPGSRVGLPGSQPAGVASAPPDARTT